MVASKVKESGPHAMQLPTVTVVVLFRPVQSPNTYRLRHHAFGVGAGMGAGKGEGAGRGAGTDVGH